MRHVSEATDGSVSSNIAYAFLSCFLILYLVFSAVRRLRAQE